MHRFMRWSYVLLLCTSSVNAQTKDGLISEWLVLGSFPCDSIHLALEKAFIAGEAKQMPQKGDRCGNLVWKDVSAGVLNFAELQFKNSEHCAAYTATYVYSPTDQNLQLNLGSADGVVVWLNERQIHRNAVYRPMKRAQDRIPLRLSAGWNRLLFKVYTASGDFGLMAELMDAEGKPAPGLAYSNRKPRDFQPYTSNAFAFIERIELGPSYAEGRERFYPLFVYLRNLGQEILTPGRLLFDARRMQSRSLPIQLRDTLRVTIPLKSSELQTLLNTRAGVSSLLSARPNDLKIFYITPDMVLTSLFKSVDLDSAATPYRTLFQNLQANGDWYTVFTGKPLDIDAKTLEGTVRLALIGHWQRFAAALNEHYTDLIQFSSAIKQDTLHMIGQSHIDMAWLWRWPETVEVTRRTFASALNFFKTEPDFKYIQSQAAAFQWMEDQEPELFKAVQDAVRNGRFFLVGGMWVEPDLNMPNGESLVRQIYYGKQYFREKFGVDCITGYTPDTFGYTWILPQILRKSGFKYFVTTKIRWNDTTKFPYSLFHWVSPDGSDILTCFPMALNVDCELDEQARHLLAFKKEHFSDLPVLYGVGDHGGGPTRQHFARIAEMQSMAAYPTAYHNDLDSYMRRIERKYTNLPVHKDELYLEFHQGTLTTQGGIKRRHRLSEVELEEAEKLAVFSELPYPKADLEKAWKTALFNQFHDILPGSSIPDVYIDAHRDYDRVDSLTRGIIDRSLAKILAKIELRGKGRPVVVFNPLSWERRDLVTMQLPAGFDVKEVVDEAGARILFQQQDRTLLFIAESVPACGYCAFWLHEGKAKTDRSAWQIGETTLENEIFRLEINPANGNIQRFFDKQHGREVLAPGQEGNILQFHKDLPRQYDAWNIGYTGESWTCEQVESLSVLEQGPVRAILRAERLFGSSRFTQDYILYHDLPRLDIRTRADWHEQHILLKAAFPVNVQTDVATYDIAYGSIQRTTHPQTAAEKAKFEVSAHKYVDLSQQDYGVALLNDCKYGHDILDNVMRLTLLRSPQTPMPSTRPDGYVAPFADQGLHEFTYGLYPHRGDHLEAASVRRGYEYNYPLLARLAENRGGALPARHSFIALDSDHVILTVVKAAENGNGHILRMYETDGRAEEVRLTAAWPVRRAYLTNLLEENEKEISVDGLTVRVPVGAYEIVSVRVE